MIVAFDLDHIVCSSISSYVSLTDVEKCTLLDGAKDAILKIKALGHSILIYTHRDASLGPETETWLNKNKIPYDRIVFNKPFYHVIIDHKAHKFIDWADFLETQKYRLNNSI